MTAPCSQRAEGLAHILRELIVPQLHQMRGDECVMVLRGDRVHRRRQVGPVVLVSAVVSGEEGCDKGALTTRCSHCRVGLLDVPNARGLFAMASVALAVSCIDDGGGDEPDRGSATRSLDVSVRRDCWHRLIERRACCTGAELRQVGCDQRMLASVRSCNRRGRLIDRMHPAIARMRQGHDEGSRVVDNIPHDPTSDPPQRRLGKRPLAREDGRARHGPIDALGCCPIRLQPVPVRGLREHDLLVVAAGDDEQALARGRRAVVARAQLAHIHLVAQVLDLSMPPAEGHAAAHRIGLAVREQRPPIGELLDVLEHDHSRPHRFHPIGD